MALEKLNSNQIKITELTVEDPAKKDFSFNPLPFLPSTLKEDIDEIFKLQTRWPKDYEEYYRLAILYPDDSFMCPDDELDEHRINLNNWKTGLEWLVLDPGAKAKMLDPRIFEGFELNDDDRLRIKERLKGTNPRQLIKQIAYARIVDPEHDYSELINLDDIWEQMMVRIARNTNIENIESAVDELASIKLAFPSKIDIYTNGRLWSLIRGKFSETISAERLLWFASDVKILAAKKIIFGPNGMELVMNVEPNFENKQQIPERRRF